MHAGELRDTAGFAGGKLLVPEPGPGNGFEDSLTACLCRNVRIADDQAQGTALGNMVEGAFDRGYKLQVVLGWGSGVSASFVSRTSIVAEELLDELGHPDSDFHPRWVNDDAVDNRLQEMLSVGAAEGLPSRGGRCSARNNPCEKVAR